MSRIGPASRGSFREKRPAKESCYERQIIGVNLSFQGGETAARLWFPEAARLGGPLFLIQMLRLKVRLTYLVVFKVERLAES